MSTDNALTLVGPIMDAYNAAEKAGSNALRQALECGWHLNDAMKAVGKFKWKKWREQNLPAVSEETERLYRRLAEALAKKEDVFTDCNSIRKAMEKLAKYNLKDMTLKPPRTSPPRTTPRRKAVESGNTVTGLQPPEPDTTTTGLEAELENAAADEIIGNIHDAEKLEDVAKATIAKLSPDKVCDALIGAWDDEQIIDLQNLLVRYLNEKEKVPATSTSSRDAGSYRRGVAVEHSS